MSTVHAGTQSEPSPIERDRRRESIYQLITFERRRQDEKFGWAGTFGSILPGPDVHAKVSVLLEEVGEVAKAVLDGEPIGNLVDELVQVAAVAVAWVESIEQFGR